MPLKRYRSNRRICGIDGAPFTVAMLGVVFVVLVFIMTAPQVHKGLSVDLPKVSHPTSMARALREDAILISINREGKVFLGNDFVWHLSDLPSKIKESIGAGAERKVYIKTDPSVPYGYVKDVLDGVRSSGVEEIAFLVFERKVPTGTPKSMQ